MYNNQYLQYPPDGREQRAPDTLEYPQGVSHLSYAFQTGTASGVTPSPQWTGAGYTRHAPAYGSQMQSYPPATYATYSNANPTYIYLPGPGIVQQYAYQPVAMSHMPPSQNLLHSQNMAQSQQYSDAPVPPAAYLAPPEVVSIPNTEYALWRRHDVVESKSVLSSSGGNSWEPPHRFHRDARSGSPHSLQQQHAHGSSEESSPSPFLHPSEPEETKPRFSPVEDSEKPIYRSSSVDDTHHHSQSMSNSPEEWVNHNNQMVMHPYIPQYGNQAGEGSSSNALVTVFKQHPDGTGRIRAPNTACYHCKHRRIKCEDRIYDSEGRPYCGSCCQRQGPCYWPPRFYAFLEADYLAAQREKLRISDPGQLSDANLDSRLLNSFDPSKCPRRISWSWRRHEQTGRFEFDDVLPTGNERVPKRRKTLEEYWWDQWTD